MRKYLVMLMVATALVVGSVAVAGPPTSQDMTVTIATDNVTSSYVALPTGGQTKFAVIIPTITSSTVKVQVSNDASSWYDLGVSTSAGTGGVVMSIPDNVAITPFTYVRVVCGTAQAADRVFKLVGK